MEFILIPLVSAAVATLTLVSGFGLGTLLMPAFALFFPVEIAIAATAVVHFANNMFKLALVGKWADRAVVVQFGVPAVIAAIVGAGLMTVVAEVPPLHTYRVGPLPAEITTLKLVIAALLALLAGLELWPRYAQLSFPRSALPIGGALSGFVGGISGMQGALRAPFLLRAGLSREAFVGTTNVISTLVDVARLAMYAAGLAWLTRTRGHTALGEPRIIWLIAVACIAGFCGSYFGAKVLKKVTLRAVRMIVAILLIAIAAAMAIGVV